MSFDETTLMIYGTSGIVVGTLYFVCVWWNARLLAGRRGTWLTILLAPGRIAVLGGLLTLAARQGAMPLLVMASGVFIARFAVVQRLRATLP